MQLRWLKLKTNLQLDMGVKGLQYFMETCCTETCVPVDLKQMAETHSNAALVVDGMACLRFWYSCQAWVQGGQWQEYIQILQEFIAAFTAAGIRLVFFFDGTVEEQKRAEWVKRRLRVNKDIARIFQHIKTHCQQPNSRDLFCLPSGLATFSRFALKSLGQETHCSVREGDYEIAHFALSQNCMGILGQDTDFVIYDTVPYLSISKLNLKSMSTVLYSREKLCRALNLHPTDLPLLSCLMGNDVVPEQQMQHLRNRVLMLYRETHKQVQGEKVYSIAEFIDAHRPNAEGMGGVSTLSLSRGEEEVMEKGIHMYLLPGQGSPWLKQCLHFDKSKSAMRNYMDAELLQAAVEKHKQAESFLVYNVLHDGVVECSNTLEDEEEREIPPQAILYLPVRERIYGLLLPLQPGTVSVSEWFVFPGNLLKEPVRVSPKPLGRCKVQPDLKALWFRTDSEVKEVQISTLLDIFDLYELKEELKQFDGPLIAVVILVTYIAMQTRQLSLEDVDAYLSQAVCVRSKSFREMQQLRPPAVDPRAVQLGSLFVRGLTYLIGANSACGLPFPMEHLMPWKTFDGLLFHSKYLLAHSGCSQEELLEGNCSATSLFLSVKQLVLDACRRRGCPLQIRPRTVQYRYMRHEEAEEQPGGRRAPMFVHPGGSRQQPEAQHYRQRHPKRGRYRLAPSLERCCKHSSMALKRGQLEPSGQQQQTSA
ncbi:hypothetical protein DNTS_004980 [Danionella cerebrum]|uniref:Asteroid domain-containing protein n=1 Tax=Danionella cerebrum TaxID=2873325 RepID=A0A553QNP2_9TELE|nr:hypothetical protein DNTS_004980 [Danionella translucida]